MSPLRMSTAGESHGPAEVCVISGVPAGLDLVPAAVDADLARRQGGYGRGGRMSIESDRCRFLAGVRHGVTLGTPIAILIENRDHANWLEAMSPEPRATSEAKPAPLTIPRPGHADLTGMAKYGHEDMRNVLERASARETVGRVAGGAVCKRLLAEAGGDGQGEGHGHRRRRRCSRFRSGRSAIHRLGGRGGVAGGLRRPRDFHQDVRSDRSGARGWGVAGRGVRGLVLGPGAGARRLRHSRRPAGRPASGRPRFHPGNQRG